MKKLVLILMLTVLGCMRTAAQSTDKELLGKALDYFQGAKYHECMLILARLDSTYTLNPRFRAFLGVCYYHEGEYDHATRQLEAVLPEVAAFAPQERSIYTWACAESHFELKHYREATVRYEETLTVCPPVDRGDALYRLGFCCTYLSDWPAAEERFTGAIAYYRRYRTTDREARIRQAEHMLAGIRKAHPSPD